jgi:hypothetical protein
VELAQEGLREAYLCDMFDYLQLLAFGRRKMRSKEGGRESENETGQV